MSSLDGVAIWRIDVCVLAVDLAVAACLMWLLAGADRNDLAGCLMYVCAWLLAAACLMYVGACLLVSGNKPIGGS